VTKTNKQTNKKTNKKNQSWDAKLKSKLHHRPAAWVTLGKSLNLPEMVPKSEKIEKMFLAIQNLTDF
jgi:hypothetical protein